MGLGHSDKPDYDKLVKLFEKGKTNIPQYLANKSLNDTLADPEAFTFDPIFLKYSKALIPDEDYQKPRLPSVVPHKNVPIGINKVYNPRLFSNIDNKHVTKY